jgi:fused signal recognition particle receptor
MGWFDSLKSGLKKSSDKIKDGIGSIFTKTKLDDETIEKFEELLLSADIGINLTTSIIKELSSEKFEKEVTSDEIKSFLREFLTNKLGSVAQYQEVQASEKPKIIMVCGVNGNGKTTTIGKMAYQKTKEGLNVILAACDTFRAAAVDQIAVWANRCNVDLISGAENSDPASVAHKAVTTALNSNADLLLIDTAGRLHNKTNLMDELRKINGVINKIVPSAPHETILVLDATTGQNALSQVEKFSEIVKITGIIVTKLDGTAKAGIVLSIIEKYKIPVIAIGVGEKIEDLNPFNLKDFLDNLLSANNEHQE